MRNYFKFNLTGGQIFGLWITYLILFVIPYIALQGMIQMRMGFFQKAVAVTGPSPEAMAYFFGSILPLYGVIILLSIVGAAIYFHVIKRIINAVEYKEQPFNFTGSFGRFIGLLISGICLSIVTLGIYYPWFAAKMLRFFSEETSYNDEALEFRGKGVNLFIIGFLWFVALFVVALLLVIILSAVSYSVGSLAPLTAFPFILIMLLTIPAFYYFIYKWMVDFRYKNHYIRWETNTWNAIGQILLQMFLTIITLGIYGPLAYLKIYAYFVEGTVAVSEDGRKTFGYNLEAGADFLYMWKYMLLTIITLGIYFPWGLCKTTKRVLDKTYVEE